MDRGLTVLAIDTAGPVIGVALGGRVRTERVTRGSEARLAPWVVALCAEAGLALSDLDGIAVARGPGAFTGLRVGLATAIGLALSAKLPVWGAMSLDHRAAAAGGTCLAMLDARKGRVYAARYRDGALVRGPEDLPPDAALAWMDGPFLTTGEGALAYADAVRAAGGTIADNADDPGVAELARMGEAALAAGRGVDPAELAPLYLREPDVIKP